MMLLLPKQSFFKKYVQIFFSFMKDFILIFLLSFLSIIINYFSHGLIFPFLILTILYLRKSDNLLLDVIIASFCDILYCSPIPLITLTYILTKATYDYVIRFVLKKSVYISWNGFIIFATCFNVIQLVISFVMQIDINFFQNILNLLLLIITYPIFRVFYTK